MESSMEELKIIVSEENEDNRIDRCIHSLMEDRSRTYIQKLIKDGNVLLNGNACSASTRVSTDDEIVLFIPEAIELNIPAENIPLDILYEDEDLLIVNKPKGMVVHPAPGHYTGTLVNALLYHCKDHLSGINGVLRPGIVHRIDRDTTGSLIVCKSNRAHLVMAEYLKEHSIDRRYRAIVHGSFSTQEGTINAPIGRNPNDRIKMAVVDNGKPAVTHYKVLQAWKEYSYVECRLETGRTHQIRVHMAHIQHPVLGDAVYSNRKSPYHLTGQTLHAYYLGFPHPITGEYLEIEAPLPDYFQHLLDILP